MEAQATIANPFEALQNYIDTRLGKVEDLIKGSSNTSLPVSTEKDLLDIDEAKEFLGLAKKTIYNMVSGNEIPYMKPGKKLYFSKAALMTWLQANGNTPKHLLQNQVAESYTNRKK